MVDLNKCDIRAIKPPEKRPPEDMDDIMRRIDDA
jgi:hypothetical protein